MADVRSVSISSNSDAIVVSCADQIPVIRERHLDGITTRFKDGVQCIGVYRVVKDIEGGGLHAACSRNSPNHRLGRGVFR